jgi:hypothetical protein
MGWSSGTYTRSNGVYSGASVWASDEAALVDIESARHDTHDQDLATGINSCLHKGGQNAATANLPMGGFKHTNVANATARTEYAVVGQIQDGSYLYGGTSGGSANTQTLSLTPNLTAYSDGLVVTFKAGFTTTAAATLNINSIGAKAFRRASGTGNLTANFIKTNTIYQIVYSSEGSGGWIVLGPGSVSDGASWSPTIGTQAGSLSSTTVVFANYTLTNDNWCSIILSVTATQNTSNADYWSFTLPVQPAATNQVFAVETTASATTGDGHAIISSTSGTGTVQVYPSNRDNVDFVSGGTRSMRVCGTYLCATP